MTSNTHEDQLSLSVFLQLLHELGYSDLDMPYKGSGIITTRDARTESVNAEIHFLDTLTVALTTGRAGDVTAAAFDNHTLILSKNADPTQEEDETVHQLLALLAKPGTTGVNQLFPFLLHHCIGNMQKRLTSLEKSLNEFQNLLKQRLVPEQPNATQANQRTYPQLQFYIPSTITEEFPHTEKYRKQVYKPNGETSFEKMLKDLITLCINLSKPAILNPDNVAASLSDYSALSLMAGQLSRSRFLTLLSEGKVPQIAVSQICAARLKRRLNKVRQYYNGMTDLVKEAKKRISEPGKPIAFQWADHESLSESAETQLNLPPDLHEVLQKAYETCGLTFSPQDWAKIESTFPYLQSNWRQKGLIHTCIHAEIRIICRIGKHHASELQAASMHIGPQRAIGVSKRSCMGCNMWIEFYNEVFRTQWITSGSHGKPYATWGLPGIVREGWTPLDHSVLYGLILRLKDTFY